MRFFLDFGSIYKRPAVLSFMWMLSHTGRVAITCAIRPGQLLGFFLGRLKLPKHYAWIWGCWMIIAGMHTGFVIWESLSFPLHELGSHLFSEGVGYNSSYDALLHRLLMWHSENAFGVHSRWIFSVSRPQTLYDLNITAWCIGKPVAYICWVARPLFLQRILWLWFGQRSCFAPFGRIGGRLLKSSWAALKSSDYGCQKPSSLL